MDLKQLQYFVVSVDSGSFKNRRSITSLILYVFSIGTSSSVYKSLPSISFKVLQSIPPDRSNSSLSSGVSDISSKCNTY